MYCQQCGLDLGEGVSTCTSCGNTAAPPATAVAVDAARAASRDSLTAFKIFASNPVPGLPLAFSQLGATRSLGVGIVFGVSFSFCVLVSAYRVLPDYVLPPGFGGFLKLSMFAFIPFASLCAACQLVRALTRMKAQVEAPVFIAGASLLPCAVGVLAAGLLGLANIEVIAIISLCALSTTILMLFVGYTKILEVPERVATLAVPLMLVATAWFSKIMYAALL